MMTSMLAPSLLLPQMVSIPGGIYDGRAIEPFLLGKNPVTNEEYNAHAARCRKAPFVLMEESKAGEIAIVGRGANPLTLLGKEMAKNFPPEWHVHHPVKLENLILVKVLPKRVGVDPFSRLRQPVIWVSWFHAFEYCVGNGLFLPTNDQWSYAAGIHEGREYATSTGKLYAEDGSTKLAHFAEKETIDVDDPRYPDALHGLRHMTGNVWEWMMVKPYQDQELDFLRGGSWMLDDPKALRASFGVVAHPELDDPIIGFRAGAPVSEASKAFRLLGD